MMNLLEKLLSGGNNHRTVTGASLNFIKSRKYMLKELQLSKDTGGVIGVYAQPLGEGMFLTVVESIDSSGKEDLITFHRYDLSGHILSRNELGISEIRMIFSFNALMKKGVVSDPTAVTELS